MNTENDTEREVEYEQTGDGQSRGGPCSGRLLPGENRTFPPCGPPPWVVVFTRTNGSKHSSRPLAAHEANATVRLERDGQVVVIP
ncbi:MAG TPA: hypothetical protein VF100_03710 [Thermoanaerobaculia bacterium]